MKKVRVEKYRIFSPTVSKLKIELKFERVLQFRADKYAIKNSLVGHWPKALGDFCYGFTVKFIPSFVDKIFFMTVS